MEAARIIWIQLFGLKATQPKKSITCSMLDIWGWGWWFWGCTMAWNVEKSIIYLSPKIFEVLNFFCGKMEFLPFFELAKIDILQYLQLRNKKKLVFVLLKLSKNAFFVQQKMDIFFYSNSLWVVVRIVEAAAVVLFSIVVWVMSFYREKTKKLVTSNQITLLLIIITCYFFYSKRPHPALHQAGYKVSMYFSPNYCLKAGWSKQLWLRE